MVNLQQKGNISEGSDEGILTEVLWKGMQHFVTPIGASFIMNMNIQLLQGIYILNT